MDQQKSIPAHSTPSESAIELQRQLEISRVETEDESDPDSETSTKTIVTRVRRREPKLELSRFNQRIEEELSRVRGEIDSLLRPPSRSVLGTANDNTRNSAFVTIDNLSMTEASMHAVDDVYNKTVKIIEKVSPNYVESALMHHYTRPGGGRNFTKIVSTVF